MPEFVDGPILLPDTVPIVQEDSSEEKVEAVEEIVEEESENIVEVED